MKLESKQDFQNLMLSFLNPLKKYYSKDKAGLCLGGAGTTYKRSTINMEGFSRPLWALSAFWAGRGEDDNFESIYQQGVVAGTNPKSDEYWGKCNDYDQLLVEMAAIACTLALAPEKIYTPLAKDEQKNLIKWLNQINEKEIPNCNWHFFRVLVNVAFIKLGVAHDEEKLSHSLAQIESYYIGDGWYMDGASEQKDYYISFAMHFYGLLYAVIMEKEDAKRAKVFKERATIFAKDFIYWFDEKGAALPFGRSLTYRFAQSSFWSACVFAEIEPFSIGVMKGLITRNLNWWLDTDMFDRENILTVGYAYQNLMMSERYNGAGSPYWGMKTFLFLALDDEHPFWKAKAEPLPKLEEVYPIKLADMLMHHRGEDTTAYTPGKCELYGHGHLIEKYSKFAYSTKYAFCIAKSQFVIEESAPDCMLAFVIDGDEYVYVRKKSEDFEIKDDCVISKWSPIKGIEVETTIIPTETGHIRKHKIKSEVACTAYDCGYSVAIFKPDFEEKISGAIAMVKNNFSECKVIGNGPKAEGMIINADPNCNLLHENVRIPSVKYCIEKGIYNIETEIID